MHVIKREIDQPFKASTIKTRIANNRPYTIRLVLVESWRNSYCPLNVELSRKTSFCENVSKTFGDLKEKKTHWMLQSEVITGMKPVIN